MWSLCAAHVEITSTLSLVVEVSFFSKMSSTAPALPPAQAVTISEEEKSEWKETFTEVRLLIYIHNFDIFRPVLEAVFDRFEFRNNIGYLYSPSPSVMTQIFA